jgi:Co/Zn/Cd efflux system component
MSTHAAALGVAALAYRFARQHSTDPRFTFGTGKIGDLAAFSSALILALIALLIGYESMTGWRNQSRSNLTRPSLLQQSA